MPPTGRLHIGTSGWSYRHWRGSFYPADLPATRWLAHYQTRFASVELNTPFYHLPRPSTVARWRSEAPDGFSFAVKGSRFITHNKKLKDPEEPLERFFTVMDALGTRMAVVLWQLPPGWTCNPGRLDAFLAAFRARAPARRLCFEFRNATWNTEEILALLRRWHAGYCIFDLAGSTSPLSVTADFVYLRLHGPVNRYAGAYGEPGLAPWADHIRAWRRRGLDVFCYFDNDIEAAAPRDAATLMRMLAEPAGAAQRLASS